MQQVVLNHICFEIEGQSFTVKNPSSFRILNSSLSSVDIRFRMKT